MCEKGPFFLSAKTPWGLSWLLACLCYDLLLRVYSLEQEVAHPFPELTLSGSLFIWSQSLASVTSHQLDQYVPEQETWHSLRSMYTSWFSLSLPLYITCFISTRSLLIRLHRHYIHIMLTGNPYSWIVINECGSVMLDISIVNCISYVKSH